jgi:hypothetical protein
MKITQTQLREMIAEALHEGFMDRLRGGDKPDPAAMKMDLLLGALDDILEHVGDSPFVEDRVEFIRRMLPRL